MARDEWPQVGDEVDADNGPKVGGSTRGILMSLTAHVRGAQAYVVSLRDGKPSSRIGCPVGSLTRTGRVATDEEIESIRDDDDLDDRDISKLVAECARLREYADILDVLRRSHPDAVRTLRQWDSDGRKTLSPQRQEERKP